MSALAIPDFDYDVFPLTNLDLVNIESVRIDGELFFCSVFAAREKTFSPRPHYRLKVPADAPTIVNSYAMRDAVYKATNTLLPVRAEISQRQIPQDISNSWPHIGFDDLKTGATGAYLHIMHPDDNEIMPDTHMLLVRNTMKKPVNPGRFNTASGLINTSNIFNTTFRKINDEILLFKRDPEDPDAIIALNLLLPRELSFTPHHIMRQVFDERQSNIARIREHLGLKYPHLADKTIKWETVDTSLLPLRANETAATATLSMPGQLQVPLTGADIFVDEVARSVNIHYAIKISLDPSELLAFINPQQTYEGASNPMLGMATFRTMHDFEYDLTPAPRNYVNNILQKYGIGKLKDFAS